MKLKNSVRGRSQCHFVERKWDKIYLEKFQYMFYSTDQEFKIVKK